MRPDQCGNSGYPLHPGDQLAVETFQRLLVDRYARDHGHLDPDLYAARWAAYERGVTSEPELPPEPPNSSAILAYDAGEPVGVWYRHDDPDRPDDPDRWSATHTGGLAPVSWRDAWLAGANPSMRMLLDTDPAADWPAPHQPRGHEADR